MNKINLRLNKKTLALLVAGGIALTPIDMALANPKYVEGTFVKEIEQDENEEYGQYVVMKNDNLSKISEKICGHYRKEVSTKYWPALAFLNGYPRVINPGDIIIYPKSFDRLVAMNEKLRKIGWTAKYIYNNQIYGVKKQKKRLSSDLVGVILEDIYGDDVCIDEDFIRTYLEINGLTDNYYLTTNGTFNSEILADLTENIPTVEQIDKYKENKSKTKRR